MRARPAIQGGGGRDADRHLGEDGGLEDSLGTKERNTGAVERESGEECCVGQDFAVKLGLLREEGERGQPHLLVKVRRTQIHSQPPPEEKRLCSAMVK
jgi:hypothetical protein